MTLQQAFEKYVAIAYELEEVIFDFSNCFSEQFHQEFKEQILHEKVSLKEKESLKIEIKSLSQRVKDLYTMFLNQTSIVETAVKNAKQYINEITVGYLNDDHLKTFLKYVPAIKSFQHLEKSYPDYNFKKIINVSAMDRQKFKLNKAIDDFNFRLLSDSKVKLMTADECIAEAEEILGPGNKIQGNE